MIWRAFRPEDRHRGGASAGNALPPPHADTHSRSPARWRTRTNNRIFSSFVFFRCSEIEISAADCCVCFGHSCICQIEQFRFTAEECALLSTFFFPGRSLRRLTGGSNPGPALAVTSGRGKQPPVCHTWVNDGDVTESSDFQISRHNKCWLKFL